MESYIIKSPINVSKIDYIAFIDTLKSKPQTITVDLQNKSFNVTFEDGNTKRLQTLSAGEQAIIMMNTLVMI